MKTYLIQRGNFENRNYKSGIDSIVKFDYMGSAEFEWGALPKSLDNIRENIKDYIYFNITIGDKSITVFCKNSQESEVEEYLNGLSKNEMRLKEYSDFNNYIFPSEYFSSETDFWWDIENNLMFWKEDENFQEKFKKQIQPKDGE